MDDNRKTYLLSFVIQVLRRRLAEGETDMYARELDVYSRDLEIDMNLIDFMVREENNSLPDSGYGVLLRLYDDLNKYENAIRNSKYNIVQVTFVDIILSHLDALRSRVNDALSSDAASKIYYEE